MGHIKAMSIDWLAEARTLSALIRDMPARPQDGGLLGVGGTPDGRVQIEPLKLAFLENLQTCIALHLAYRLRVVHKVTWTAKSGKKGMFIIEDRDPESFAAKYRRFSEIGVQFTDSDKRAMTAHELLGHVLRNGYVWPDWKTELPLIVASIGGDSISKAASTNAAKPRPGRIDKNAELRDAKLRRLGHSPWETWKEVLLQLEGDLLVTEWDEKSITWVTSEGETRTTKTKTFQGWK